MPNYGFKHTQETRLKMSASQRGRRHSQETRLRISLANKGRKFSKEHRNNLTIALKNRKITWGGWHHTEETKNRLRLLRLGKKLSARTKKKMGLSRIGKNNSRWNGGKRIHKMGYIYVKAPKNHPTQHYDGYILEHRIIMEKHLGRLLKRKEIVHHINQKVNDNRIENLMLFPNVTAHINYHKQLNK